MAGRRKRQAKKVRFELTYSGIAGIGIVCFCIFLWMFLLGVWTGQTLLLPSPEGDSGARDLAQNSQAEMSPLPDSQLHIEPVREKKLRKEQ